MISNDCFVVITGWMINELKLSGHELQAYAIVYGFSQNGEGAYSGSINYICDFLSVSRPTAIKIMKSLTDKNYIIKEQKIVNNVTFNEYKANLLVVKKFNGGSKETLPGVVKKFNGGSKETLPNNKYNTNNIILNNINNIKETKPKTQNLDTILNTIDNSNLKAALNDYIEFRQKMKKPLTPRALELAISKLKTLSNDEETQIEIINQSIFNGWLGLFQLKDDTKVDNTPKQQIDFSKYTY